MTTSSVTPSGPESLPPPPRYGTASLADLLPALLARLGVGPDPAGAGRPSARLPLPEQTRVVLLLVDGLGLHQLRDHTSEAPLLTEALDPGDSLDAGFPSTTPISLTSLGVGAPPGEHGITGLLLRLGRDEPLLDMLSLAKDVDPLALQPRATAFERAAAAGVAVTQVGPRRFAGAGLTAYGLRGGRFAGADGAGERVAAVQDAVRRGGDRSLTYVYWGDLDATGHRCGVDSAAWREELRHVDRLAEQLADALPPDVALVVTADHGMVDVPPARRIDLADRPDLDRGLVGFAGDPRALNLHALPGCAGEVERTWSDALGDDAWVLARDAAVRAGWFGPSVRPEVLPRLGDVVVAMRSDCVVLDSRVLPPVIVGFTGVHGSLTEAEQRVPLVTLLPR